MKMMFKFLSSPLDFANGKSKMMVIENNSLFRNTILELYAENQNDWFVFSKDYKPIDYGKKVRFIGEPLNVNINDRKLIAKINSDLENTCNNFYYEKIMELKEKLLCLCNDLATSMDFDIEFNDNIETSAFVKLCSFSPKNDYEVGMEKLCRLLILLKTYLGVECFVVQNLYLYFSAQEIEDFLQTLLLNEICLLDIERNVPDVITDNVNLVIIDKDLCVVDN